MVVGFNQGERSIPLSNFNRTNEFSIYKVSCTAPYPDSHPLPHKGDAIDNLHTLYCNNTYIQLWFVVAKKSDLCILWESRRRVNFYFYYFCLLFEFCL